MDVCAPTKGFANLAVLRRARVISAAALGAAVFALAACGRGGPRVLPAAGGAVNASSAVKVTLSIAVPGTQGSAGRRRPLYVSAATQSASVAVDGVSQTVGCGQVCTTTLSVQPGTRTFQINLYDGPNATGHILSSGSTTTNIVVGQNNTVAIAFGGVPAKLVLGLGSSSLTAGSPATVPITVTALDAAGQTIVGSDPYTSAIDVTSSDTSGATTLSAPVVLSPAGVETLTYTGGSAPPTITLTAQIPNSTVAPVSSSLNVVSGGQRSGAYAAAVLAASPIAFYQLNDSSSTMTDSGVNHVTGTYGSSVTHSSTPLTSDAAAASALFAGGPAGSNIAADTGTTIANAAFATAQNALTVEAWIKPSATNQTGTFVPIVAYGRQAQGQAWFVQLTPQSTLNLYFKTTTGTFSAKSTTSISPGQIYYVAAVFNGSSASLYVNGALEQSVPASGSINYGGLPAQYGLCIGGALGGTLPIFSGAVADVAIYNTPLSAAGVMSHYLTGNRAQVLNEQARSSDGFVDTIGVVTHLNAPAYTSNWNVFQSLFLSSGIRHIRDGLVASTVYQQRLAALASVGIRATLDTSLTQTSATITSLIAQDAAVLEAVDGPNEPDVQGNANWLAQTIAFEPMLWQTVKGNPATATLPVLGTPLVSTADDLALGNQSAYMDYGNMHDYFAGRNPGTPGWGSTSQYGTYGSISFNLAIAGIVSGSKPVVATETGYTDNPADPVFVSDRTLGRYIPRLYLMQYLRGVPRTLLFSFYDEGSGNTASVYGLVDQNNVPKPSYTAVKSLIRLLADPGSSFSPATLSYSIGGNVNNLQHLLLQKRDGTFELVLWLEVPSYNVVSHVDIPVAAQNVTVQLPASTSSTSISSFDDLGNAFTSPAAFTGGAVVVPVDDRVSVLSFK